MNEILNSGAGVALVTGVLSIIGVAVAEVLRRQHKTMGAVKANSDIVREQTTNTHKTNLRDDLDEVAALVREVLVGQGRHAEEIANLRVDAAWERRERMDLAARLSHHIEHAA